MAGVDCHSVGQAVPALGWQSVSMVASGMDGDVTAPYRHGEPVSSAREGEYGHGGRQPFSKALLFSFSKVPRCCLGQVCWCSDEREQEGFPCSLQELLHSAAVQGMTFHLGVKACACHLVA